MKRLHADAIACNEKLAFAFVPDRESKHPTQALDTALPFVFVEMNYGFGVGAGLEGVSPANQIIAQLLKVVDLTIENDPY